MSIYSMIVREKPTGVLILLLKKEGICQTKVARELDYTYSAVLVLIRAMQDKGFVLVRKVGRQQKLYLTNKGQILAHNLNNIRELMKC